jgi:hypothetical protein
LHFKASDWYDKPSYRCCWIFLFSRVINYAIGDFLQQVSGAKTALKKNDDKSGTEPGPFPWGWAAVVAIIVLAVASHSGMKTVSSPVAPTKGLVSSTPQGTETPLPVEDPISEITLKTAARHAGLALGADGIDGATTYSVNCWAALERTFSLTAAERCATFDALILGNAEVASSAMQQWFAEVPVAARYQSALNSNGVNVGDIPNRLERLRVAAAIQTVKPVVPKVVNPPAAAVTEDDIELSAEQDASDSLAIENESATDQ